MVDETAIARGRGQGAVPLGDQRTTRGRQSRVLLKREVVVTGDQGLTDASLSSQSKEGAAVSVGLDSAAPRSC